MPQAAFKRPLTSPASIPTHSAASIAAQTLTPWVKSITNTAPPVQKDPSTVRSAISRIL